MLSGSDILAMIERLLEDTRRELESVDVTSGRSQQGKNAVAERGSVCQHRLEARARITRRREDRDRDRVERKNPPAAAARLNLLLRRVDNRVDDFERLARTWPNEAPHSAIERAGELRLEVPGPAQKIHVSTFSALALR